jgi:hypothetical protein
MTIFADRLWNALVDHLGASIIATPITDHVLVDKYLISYGLLIERAGLSAYLAPRSISPFLREIAEECSKLGLKPLNALAVNGETRMPGASYDDAGGFKLTDWARDVPETIKTTYPRRKTK